MKVDTQKDSSAAERRIHEMLDRKAFREAVAFAEACVGNGLLVEQVRAFTWAEAGFRLQDTEMIGKALAVWHRHGTDKPGIAYNVANSEYELWRLAVNNDGRVEALEGARKHLHRARRLFDQVGDDSAAPEHLRVQALTNLGNTYDHMGRDIDALDCYERALELDPRFGMALGNKGIALLGISPYMGGHKHAVLAPAVEALDAAVADSKRVVQFGGLSALEHFKAERGRLRSSAKNAHKRKPRPTWEDPYLGWCLQHGLFLHVSQACIRADLEKLDPLFFTRVVTSVDDAGQARAARLFDGFSATKQEYISARYLAWLSVASESPIYEHARDVSEKVVFPDSLTYARWGVRTGMSLLAFSAAVNVLDKVAGLAHMYFETGRIRDVYFRTLWHRKKSPKMDAELASQLTKHGLNRGLLALCDLSCDIEQDTPLNKFIERRHTATHRFLVAHELLADAENDEWMERIGWQEIVQGTVKVLGIARAGLLYLARMIDIHEKALAAERSAAGKIAISGIPLPWTHGEID